MTSKSGPSYFKEALKSPKHWASLGAVVGATVVGAVTGLWIPLVAAASVEALYLSVVPSVSPFRRRVDAKFEAAARAEKEARVNATVAGLTLADRGKFVEIRALADQIRRSFSNADPETKATMEPTLARLEELVDGYLKMLVGLSHYERLLKAVRRDDLADEIAEIELEMQTVSERVRESKARRLEIVKARLAKIDHAGENREILETQIETIEDILRLLNESSMTIRDPRALNADVDRLVDGITGSEAALRELDALLGETPELDIASARE
ncbi:MAG: hypothetical protein HYY84_17565 [Deltaproteobacteria bacterium]|nr:hypothetical protein [Deltaproteobacteria bacterium]